MSKITVANKVAAQIVSCQLEGKEKINETEIQILSGKPLSGLLPLTYTRTLRGLVLQYDVSSMVSLEAFFRHPMKKEEFVAIIRQTVEMLRALESNRLYVRNVLLDYSMVFIDTVTLQLGFIYRPVLNGSGNANLVTFFAELPYRAVFDTEDTSYVAQYVNYFKNLKGFSIAGVEQLVRTIEGAKIKSHRPGYTTSHANGLENNGVRDGETGGCGGSTALNSQGENNRFVERRTEGTTILEECVSCGTTVLDVFEGEATAWGWLIRIRTDERIPLTKLLFIVGKEPSYADYVVKDNSAVSRNHASFSVRDGRYYVRDNNSTNRTYVDGISIPPRKEVEIFNDNKIRLGNEEFIFRVEG